MSELYLIAHLVRGKPAFDIAQQMECPHCSTWPHNPAGCTECDGAGHWWIIPTSGHRAYPYWYISLNQLMPVELIDLQFRLETSHLTVGEAMEEGKLPPPPNHPDHYANQTAARGTGITDLSFLKPKLPVIKRRL